MTLGPIPQTGAARNEHGECIDPRCRRRGVGPNDPGECMGYHCPHCDKPVGMMGHDCPEKKATA